MISSSAGSSAGSSTRPLAWSEACERNRDPILQVLKSELPVTGRVLEIGSGTGQHAEYFARHLPQILWQASDQPRLPEPWNSLVMRLAEAGLENLSAPLILDVDAEDAAPQGPFAAVFSANTAHIMSWPSVTRMFSLVARVLQPGGKFLLYGPFNEHGRFTSDSNRHFHESLRARNPAMGIRDLQALEELGRSVGLTLSHRHPMPANNQILVFEYSQH